MSIHHDHWFATKTSGFALPYSQFVGSIGSVIVWRWKVSVTRTYWKVKWKEYLEKIMRTIGREKISHALHSKHFPSAKPGKKLNFLLYVRNWSILKLVINFLNAHHVFPAASIFSPVNFSSHNKLINYSLNFHASFGYPKLWATCQSCLQRFWEMTAGWRACFSPPSLKTTQLSQLIFFSARDDAEIRNCLDVVAEEPSWVLGENSSGTPLCADPK